MGLYLNVRNPKNKVEQIIEQFGAEVIPAPDSFEVPHDKRLLCVVENPMFDAALVVMDHKEWRRIENPQDIGDDRPRTFLLIDRVKCDKATGVIK